MASVLHDTWETYTKNLGLILLFSIPFIIAFLIPLLAPLPTFLTAGGIFLRSASIFVNLNILSVAVIIISLFVSLLFLSFAFVAISLIVKATRTHTRTGKSVLKDIEKYIAKVFVVWLIFQFLLIVINIVGYLLNIEALLTAVGGFIIFSLIFYAPSAIVVDNKRIPRAIIDSARLVVREPQYFLMWLGMITVILSVIDFLAIGITGTLASRYIVLIISSLFVLPYFVIFMAEAYMKRFPILKRA
ncbi:MAG: hypothetical protein KGH59_04165 [Candidatus Micrarchaeota archaeon]|nr:hypothetical protein [Candidatus Micrarchaeota archaeon]MDE1804947.1 hypothetical protein [Candidatus Micrarchaeota archaeon]MDE1846768.1 hypothetical protein [Candidatus Micrarchaeota archaeon]